MKNKYCRCSHLKETKFREVLRLFCADLEASKIVTLTGINKNTAQKFTTLFRERITALAEKESFFSTGEIEIDESYFGAKRVRGKRGRGAAGKTPVFGMKKRGDKVYTQIVKNCSAQELVPIIKRLAPDDSTVYSDEWKAYDGLASLGYKRHYRVKHSGNVFANGKAHVNGIENFWGIAKTRLVKFRGIHKDKFYFFLKETEWRFNHRQDEIYRLLLSEFRANPL